MAQKILLIDIETSPNLGYVWGKYQQDVIRFNKEWYILCFAAKWLGAKEKVFCESLPDYSLYKKDPSNDKALLQVLHDLLSQADIVVAHNGDDFDFKKINARFMVHGMEPPAPYKTVDTLKVARRYFGFTSNKLGDLAQTLSIDGGKIDTTFNLWLGCLAGDNRSWAKMRAYNKRDVELLEEVYMRLRPWDSTHPNAGVLTEGLICPRCESKHMQSRGTYVAKTRTYQRFQCQDCGGWMRAFNASPRGRKPQVAI